MNSSERTDARTLQTPVFNHESKKSGLDHAARLMMKQITAASHGPQLIMAFPVVHKLKNGHIPGPNNINPAVVQACHSHAPAGYNSLRLGLAIRPNPT